MQEAFYDILYQTQEEANMKKIGINTIGLNNRRGGGNKLFEIFSDGTTKISVGMINGELAVYYTESGELIETRT